MSTTRLSLTQDIPRLKQIWKKCFQDPDAFIDFYFAQFHEPDQSMVLLVDGEIASMLTMIPLTLQLRTDCTVPALCSMPLPQTRLIKARGWHAS